MKRNIRRRSIVGGAQLRQDVGATAHAEIVRLVNAGRVEGALERADVALEGFGIEAGTDRGERKPVVLYVNTGDTYNMTLLYDVVAHKFYYTTLGDWVERFGERRDLY
jgi:hypothetical protein